MFKLKISRDILEDLVKKMAIPTGKDEYVFKTIAPTITPDGRLTWIGKNKFSTVWVRAKGLDVSGITEPIVIAFKSAEILKTLKLFKKKNDVIVLTHDTENSVDVFTTNNEKGKRTVKLPSIVESEAKEKQDVFPGQIGEDGVIVYKGGLKPNLYCKCDVSVFKELVKNTNKVKGKKKREEKPNNYHIIFDEEHGMLRTFAEDKEEKSYTKLDDEISITDVKGNGTVHFSYLFPDVMNALSGEIELWSIEKGPLYIMQNSENVKIRYLISPARVD